MPRRPSCRRSPLPSCLSFLSEKPQSCKLTATVLSGRCARRLELSRLSLPNLPKKTVENDLTLAAIIILHVRQLSGCRASISFVEI